MDTVDARGEPRYHWVDRRGGVCFVTRLPDAPPRRAHVHVHVTVHSHRQPASAVLLLWPPHSSQMMVLASLNMKLSDSHWHRIPGPGQLGTFKLTRRRCRWVPDPEVTVLVIPWEEKGRSMWNFSSPRRRIHLSLHWQKLCITVH